GRRASRYWVNCPHRGADLPGHFQGPPCIIPGLEGDHLAASESDAGRCDTHLRSGRDGSPCRKLTGRGRNIKASHGSSFGQSNRALSWLIRFAFRAALGVQCASKRRQPQCRRLASVFAAGSLEAPAVETAPLPREVSLYLANFNKSSPQLTCARHSPQLIQRIHITVKLVAVAAADARNLMRLRSRGAIGVLPHRPG